MPAGYLLIIIAFIFIYMVLLRPQRRRQIEQARMLASLKEGDEVVTAGGLYGTITGFQDDDPLVEIAPELEVRVARRAIAARAPAVRSSRKRKLCRLRSLRPRISC